MVMALVPFTSALRHLTGWQKTAAGKWVRGLCVFKGEQVQLLEPAATRLFRLLFNPLNFVNLDCGAAPEGGSAVGREGGSGRRAGTAGAGAEQPPGSRGQVSAEGPVSGRRDNMAAPGDVCEEFLPWPTTPAFVPTLTLCYIDPVY